MYIDDRNKSRPSPPLAETGLTILHARIVEESVARLPKQKDESFGHRLRRLRAAKGFTEAELGQTVGTSHRMIAYYEVQGGKPPADVVAKLARALGVSADELLGLSPAKSHKEAAGPEDLRLMRKFRQLKLLPPKDRRSVLHLIDSLAEKKRAQG
jgi:transcriptional regulator with XRE-family HTH domain